MKQYRLNLEFELNIQDMNEMLVRRRLKQIPNYEEVKNEPSLREMVEHQRMLLEGLLDNKETLEKYVHKLWIDMFEAYALNLLKEQLKEVEEDEQTILSPIIQGLSPKARKFFEEVMEEGIFSENTREFQECFQFKLVNAKVD